MIPVAGTSVAAGLSISDHNVIGEQDGIHSRDLLECRPWGMDFNPHVSACSWIILRAGEGICEEIRGLQDWTSSCAD